LVDFAMPRRLCYLLLPAILCAASVAPTVGRADDVVDSADLSEADLELDVSLELEELTERDSGWFEDPSRYGPHQDFERGNWWGWLPKWHTYSRAIERTPDMMGDFFSGESIAVQTNAIVENFVLGDLPVAGGSRNTKVAEHNRAIPTDRVYFSDNDQLGFQRVCDVRGAADDGVSDRKCLGIGTEPVLSLNPSVAEKISYAAVERL
jgi:hypothetical protein